MYKRDIKLIGHGGNAPCKWGVTNESLSIWTSGNYHIQTSDKSWVDYGIASWLASRTQTNNNTIPNGQGF